MSAIDPRFFTYGWESPRKAGRRVAKVHALGWHTYEPDCGASSYLAEQYCHSRLAETLTPAAVSHFLRARLVWPATLARAAETSRDREGFQAELFEKLSRVLLQSQAGAELVPQSISDFIEEYGLYLVVDRAREIARSEFPHSRVETLLFREPSSGRWQLELRVKLGLPEGVPLETVRQKSSNMLDRIADQISENQIDRVFVTRTR